MSYSRGRQHWCPIHVAHVVQLAAVFLPLSEDLTVYTECGSHSTHYKSLDGGLLESLEVEEGVMISLMN